MTGAGEAATFSNYGATSVHVFAPGESILSTYQPKTYKWSSGTSMATPFVSAILGLALSKDINLNYKELKDMLINTSIMNPELENLCVGGRVDAFDFLNKILI